MDALGPKVYRSHEAAIDRSPAAGTVNWVGSWKHRSIQLVESRCGNPMDQSGTCRDHTGL